MQDVVVGGALLASFVGGMVALLAPCCVSVMVPAYLAAAFGRRRGVLAATGVFAVGVATVIVPIGLGASMLSAALSRYHLLVFSLGGAAMVAGGMAMLAGWRPQLPLPRAHPVGHGVASVYGLGVFSGVASACCAPVLAGVALLSGAAASFPAALAVSLTYAAGMVAPLAALAAVWDRRDWPSSRWLHGRQVTIRVGSWHRRMALGHVLAGGLLVAMGALTIALAFNGPAMPNSGWRVEFAANLQHVAALITGAMDWLPGWTFGLILLAAVAVLVLLGRRATGRATTSDTNHATGATAYTDPQASTHTTRAEGPANDRAYQERLEEDTTST